MLRKKSAPAPSSAPNSGKPILEDSKEQECVSLPAETSEKTINFQVLSNDTGDTSIKENEKEYCGQLPFNGPDRKTNYKSDALKLVLTQNADGSFPFTEDVAIIIGSTVPDLLEQSNAIEPIAWITMICIEFLEKFFQEEKPVWELVVLKANKWLNSNFKDYVGEQRERAKDFVTRNLSRI